MTTYYLANRAEIGAYLAAGRRMIEAIDHVLPAATGGQTVAEDLALACISSSLRTSTRQTAPDPATIVV